MNRPNNVTASVRKMDYCDLAAVLDWRNNPAVRNYMYTQHEIKRQEHHNWFEKNRCDPTKHLLIVEGDRRPLGFVNFNEVASGIAEWGFYAAPESPKGSGRVLCSAALDHAFIQLGLQKINGQALAHNKRSIELHRSLGFQQERVLSDHHFDGESYQHVFCFGLSAEEWQNRTPFPKSEHHVEKP